jgi:hypothetical protein
MLTSMENYCKSVRAFQPCDPVSAGLVKLHPIVQHVAKSFAIRTMWGEAAVGFAEGADQRIPVLSAKFYKSYSIHDEFNSLPQATRA